MRPGSNELDLATTLDCVVLRVDVEVGNLGDTLARRVLRDGRDTVILVSITTKDESAGS